MTGDKVRVFISHNAEDETVAAAIKDFLESVFLNAEVFVSTRDLAGGELWVKTIQAQLEHAIAIVALVLHCPTTIHGSSSNRGPASYLGKRYRCAQTVRMPALYVHRSVFSRLATSTARDSRTLRMILPGLLPSASRAPTPVERTPLSQPKSFSVCADRLVMRRVATPVPAPSPNMILIFTRDGKLSLSRLVIARSRPS
jgi:hypothetical protein